MDTEKEWKTFSTKRSMVISRAWVRVCARVHECVCANTKAYDTSQTGVWSDDGCKCTLGALHPKSTRRKTNCIANEKKVNFSFFVCVCVCELGVEVCDRSPKTTRQWHTGFVECIDKGFTGNSAVLKFHRTEKRKPVTYFYALLQTDQTEVVNKSPSATELAFSCEKWGLWCWFCARS